MLVNLAACVFHENSIACAWPSRRCHTFELQSLRISNPFAVGTRSDHRLNSAPSGYNSPQHPDIILHFKAEHSVLQGTLPVNFVTCQVDFGRVGYLATLRHARATEEPPASYISASKKYGGAENDPYFAFSFDVLA